MDNKEDYRYHFQAILPVLHKKYGLDQPKKIVELLAALYDPTKTYAVGEATIHWDDTTDFYKFYRCISDITTPEAFTPAHWQESKVSDSTGGGGSVPAWLVSWATALKDKPFNAAVLPESLSADNKLVSKQALLAEIAELEAAGKLDDVKVFLYGTRADYTIEKASMSEFPVTGSTKYIYKATDTGKQYEWDSTLATPAYVELTDASTKWACYFPATGIKDVQYVDDNKQIAYIWSLDDSGFCRLQAVASEAEIQALFPAV